MIDDVISNGPHVGKNHKVPKHSTVVGFEVKPGTLRAEPKLINRFLLHVFTNTSELFVNKRTRKADMLDLHAHEVIWTYFVSSEKTELKSPRQSWKSSISYITSSELQISACSISVLLNIYLF